MSDICTRISPGGTKSSGLSICGREYWGKEKRRERDASRMTSIFGLGQVTLTLTERKHR